MDLGAVKAAEAPRLAACAVGAAANAQDLLDDAELLSAAARHARAYAGYSRTPEAAAHMLLNAVSKLQEQTTTSASRPQ